MDILSRALLILSSKGWYEELRNEFAEVMDNMDKDAQEQLLNILVSDKVSIEHIKELFRSSINTTNKYKTVNKLK